LLRALLAVEPISIETLPGEVVRAWKTPDGQGEGRGRAGRSVNDDAALKRFTRAVLAVEPTATGGPVSILKSGYTIIGAFTEAGLWALVSISVILWITLRRFGDVLLTLVPLLLAGVVTLEICALIDLPLNFANIIALPLLLGIGVAFKIYYIMAWRAGQTNLLQSSLTRAVLFSALTTATAFGSLCFEPPGPPAWASSSPFRLSRLGGRGPVPAAADGPSRARSTSVEAFYFAAAPFGRCGGDGCCFWAGFSGGAGMWAAITAGSTSASAVCGSRFHTWLRPRNVMPR